MNHISDLFFKGITLLFRYLPFRVIYILSDFLYTLLYRVGKYRFQVISQNLKGSFPEKQDSEINGLIKRFYLNFSDILMETLKGLAIKKESILQRYKFINANLLDQDFENNQNVIILASHHTNWEWAVLSINLWLKHQVVGVYKPIKNKRVDTFFNTRRKKWGLELISMSKTARALAKRRRTPAAFVFIADQTPSDIKNAHWINFLNRPTAFHHGMDKIARRTNYPVYLADIKRVKRGFYEVEFSLLCPEPGKMKESEVTEHYAKGLEDIIKKDPANWLWSHRRWKRKKEDLD
jgi:KDO2-lipid IV(A) lauroyltransferase